MKITYWILLAFCISFMAFFVASHLNAGERWYRARYDRAMYCYIEGDNPNRIKEENMVFFSTRKACRDTLGSPIAYE